MIGARIANAPVSWGILEVGEWGDTPYTAFLDALSTLGYTGTELGPPGYLPTVPEALTEALQSRGLEMVGAFVPVAFARWNEGELQRIAEIATHLKRIGSPHMLIADGGERGRRSSQDKSLPGTGFTEPEWQTFGVALQQIYDVCQNIGLGVQFHHHVGSFIESPDEVVRLLDIAEPIGVRLCFDTGHFIWAGGEVLPFVQQYGRLIGHLHLKDVHLDRLNAARETRLDFVNAVKSGIFVPLGDGAIDFEPLFAVLADVNYDGWIVVEQDRLGEYTVEGALDPQTAAGRSIAFLKRCFAKGRTK